MRELLEFNRYLHDFTAAMWTSGAILLWILLRDAVSVSATGEWQASVRRVARKVSFITVPCLLCSLITGGVRAITFRQFEFVGEITNSLIVALAIKHALFLAMIVWGIRVHVRVRRVGGLADIPRDTALEGGQV